MIEYAGVNLLVEDKDLQAFTSSHIPKPEGLVSTPRQRMATIRAQTDGTHIHGMTLEGSQTLSTVHIPKPESLVSTPRQRIVTIRPQIHGVHPSQMPLEGF